MLEHQPKFSNSPRVIPCVFPLFCLVFPCFLAFSGTKCADGVSETAKRARAARNSQQGKSGTRQGKSGTQIAPQHRDWRSGKSHRAFRIPICAAARPASFDAIGWFYHSPLPPRSMLIFGKRVFARTETPQTQHPPVPPAESWRPPHESTRAEPQDSTGGEGVVGRPKLNTDITVRFLRSIPRPHCSKEHKHHPPLAQRGTSMKNYYL